MMIMCPPHRYHPRDPNSRINPSAVFEVLSPSTQVFDRTGKFDEYKQIRELTDYILVDTERLRVEHFSRLENEKWVLRVYLEREQALKLENFDITVPLSEIYEDVALEAALVRPILGEG